METVLAVGLGGFIGSILRYLISLAAAGCTGDFPLGTFLVNAAGGFLMGFLMEAGVSLWNFPPVVRTFLTTGILGGLTTFSTFSYETVSLLSAGKYGMGGLNAALNLFTALFACYLGRSAVRLIAGARLL